MLDALNMYLMYLRSHTFKPKVFKSQRNSCRDGKFFSPVRDRPQRQRGWTGQIQSERGKFCAQNWRGGGGYRGSEFPASRTLYFRFPLPFLVVPTSVSFCYCEIVHNVARCRFLFLPTLTLSSPVSRKLPAPYPPPQKYAVTSCSSVVQASRISLLVNGNVRMPLYDVVP